jgi:hypothetical protein
MEVRATRTRLLMLAFGSSEQLYYFFRWRKVRVDRKEKTWEMSANQKLWLFIYLFRIGIDQTV